MGCPVAELTSGKARFGWKIRAMLIALIGINLFMQTMTLSLMQEREVDVVAADATHLRPNRELTRGHAQHRNPLSTSPNPLEVAAESSSGSGLPIYTREMASRAVRPATWTCGDGREVAADPVSGEKTMFAFVHVYKAAGSTVRDFFRTYAGLCKKNFMVLVSCTGVTPSDMRSDQNWKRCRVKEFLDGRNKRYEHESMKEARLYPTVNNTILKDDVDVYGGHFRIGTGDNIFGHNIGDDPMTPSARPIVFLRDPMNRFVSGILYQVNANQKDVAKIEAMQKNNGQQMEDIVKMIKKRVRGSRKKNEYWGASLSYLLTPNQAQMFPKMKERNQTALLSPEEHAAESKALAAIQNLVGYPVIMGMAERMSQSMNVLRHVFVSDRFTSEKRKQHAKGVFKEYFDENESDNNVRKNASERDGVSTASVLQELKKDAEFMVVFEEYIKYEQKITDFAWNMHVMQHEVVTGSGMTTVIQAQV